MDKKSYRVDIDTKTFIRFWLVIAALGVVALFVWKALPGLIIVGIAIFLAIAIQPLAERIKRLTKKENSSFASVLAYTIIIVIIGVILAIVAPVVIDETVRFVRQLPTNFEHTIGGWDGINSLGENLGIEDLRGEILSGIQSFSKGFVANFGNILASGIGAISQIATATILTLVLTLLLAIEGPTLIDAFWKVIEGRRKNSNVRAYKRLAERIAGVISTYMSKQVTVALLDGCVVTAAVLILSLACGFSSSLALPMGLIAMVLYLIPMFGPIISCALVSVLLFFSSPIAAIIYLVFYIIYAQIENNVIGPKLQGDALKLPTALILTAVIIGMYMFGLIGAIISIPIAGCIKVLIEELPNLRGDEPDETDEKKLLPSKQK